MLLEDAAALAELGYAGIPGAALRDGDLQALLRPRSVARDNDRDQHARPR